MSNGLHSFLIIGVPDGEAPLEKRQAWVGVILQGIPCHDYVLGVISGQPSAQPCTGYEVNAREAIRRLESHPDGSLARIQAAEWWRDHFTGVLLVFDAACCQRIEG